MTSMVSSFKALRIIINSSFFSKVLELELLQWVCLHCIAPGAHLGVRSVRLIAPFGTEKKYIDAVMCDKIR